MRRAKCGLRGADSSLPNAEKAWVINVKWTEIFFIGRGFVCKRRAVLLSGARWHVVPLAGRYHGSLVVDGKQGEIYPQSKVIDKWPMALGTDAKRASVGNKVSPDGKHIAYAINTDRETRVFIDNEPGPVFDSVVNGPFFTPDGNHFAYLA